MAEIKKMGYCVNGEWKESKAEKYMDVTDSSTGEVIAQVPCCTPDEVEEAIASAQAAFPEWSSLSLAKRQQYMFRWRDVLYAHKEELSVLCAKELGKNIKEARGDVQKAIEPTEEACALPTGSLTSANGHTVFTGQYANTECPLPNPSFTNSPHPSKEPFLTCWRS